MAGELMKVPFHGGTLEACERDGKVWVGVRAICEGLGIAFDPQRVKLQNKSWACVTEIVMQVEGDDQKRTYAVIDLDTVPLWLATIDERKVAPAVRPKLVRYQREAARVLADHFFRRHPQPPPPPTPAPAPLPDVTVSTAVTVVTPGPIFWHILNNLTGKSHGLEQQIAAGEKRLGSVHYQAAYAKTRANEARQLADRALDESGRLRLRLEDTEKKLAAVLAALAAAGKATAPAATPTPTPTGPRVG